MIFAGSILELNYSTSGGGSIYVELQDETGSPVPGFTLDDCPEIFGDLTAGDVVWEDDPDLRALAGRPTKMRIRMRDADLYAFRFRRSE
jgi:hypothetical protein